VQFVSPHEPRLLPASALLMVLLLLLLLLTIVVSIVAGR
jgi:hypothetical protein